jgi:phosphoglycolate phosphatase
MSSTYKHFIFDFDGTLADSVDWVIRTLNDVAAHHGFRSVNEDEIQMLRGRPNREIVKFLGVPAWKVPLIATDMRARIAADIEQIKLFPGTDQLLADLEARGSRIAVVTSNSEANVRRILGAKNSERFHRFECGASIFGKARRFRRVIQDSGVSAAETICIGDETRDIDAAKSIGAASGAVSWGYATPDVLAAHQPDHLFEQMAAIVELA